MAKLIIQRPSKFVSRVRAFKVILDGEIIGTVKNGATAEFEIPTGNHTLRTGISHMSGFSPIISFSATNDETITFSTSPHPLMLLFIFIAIIFGILIGSSFSQGFGLEIIIILIVPILICAFLAYKFAITLKQNHI